jgi:hypothetical protein
MVKHALICLSILIITGCTAIHKPFVREPIPDGKAAVYFYRSGDHRIKVGILNDDNESLTYLFTNTYFTYHVDPGWHAFRADAQFNREEVVILAKAGREYCLKVDTETKKIGTMVAHFEYEKDFKECEEDLGDARKIYSIQPISYVKNPLSAQH